MMASLQSRVTEIISGKKTKRAILAALKAAGVYAEDASEECGYMNIRIPAESGYVRIYRDSVGCIIIQRFEPVNMKYSGVTTFEPSGRRSF